MASVRELDGMRILHVVGEAGGNVYAVVLDPALYRVLFNGGAMTSAGLAETVERMVKLFGVERGAIERKTTDSGDKEIVLTISVLLPGEGNVILYPNPLAAEEGKMAAEELEMRSARDRLTSPAAIRPFGEKIIRL